MALMSLQSFLHKVYICIWICIWIYICIWICIWIYVYTYICTFLHKVQWRSCHDPYFHMYVYTCVCIYMYIHVYIYWYVYTHIYTCMYMYVLPSRIRCNGAHVITHIFYINKYIHIYFTYTHISSRIRCEKTISRLLKIIGLFCKRALQKRPIFCKEWSLVIWCIKFSMGWRSCHYPYFHIYVYTCVCIYMYIHVYIHWYVYIHICICVYM